MATCEECIHSEVCDQSGRQFWNALANETECSDFKNKSDYVKRERGEWKKMGLWTFTMQ